MENGPMSFCRRNAFALVLGAVVAAVILGSVPLAFALESEGSDRADAAGSECAFKLGHVAIDCVGLDESEGVEEGEDVDGGAEEEAVAAQKRSEGDGSMIALGEPTQRAYRITNEGEEAYVRLASRMLAGEMDRSCCVAVWEEAQGRPEESPDEAEASADEAEQDEAADERSAWQHASDGFWYRPLPLAAGESIVVNVAVEIPFEDAWVEALSTGEGCAVEEALVVEAMQARHNAIDLSSEHPWTETPEKAQPEDAVAGEEESGVTP